MANRYWVGGTGNWGDTTSWSATDGGSSGASIPAQTDDVFITPNSGFGAGGEISGTGTYGSVVCNNFTSTSGHTYTIDYVTSDFFFYGDFVGESGLSFTSGSWSVPSGSGESHTITSNGCTFYYLDFGSTSRDATATNTWTFTDKLVVTSSIGIDHAVTVIFDDISATVGGFTLSANSGVTSTLTLGNSYIDGVGTLYDFSSGTMVVNSGNSTLAFTRNSYMAIECSITFNEIIIDTVYDFIEFYGDINCNSLIIRKVSTIFPYGANTITANNIRMIGSSGNEITIYNNDYVVDSYTGSSGSTAFGTNATYKKHSQSFTGDGGTLASLNIGIVKAGSPTGNVWGEIYAHSGTYGTSSVPTGSVLATSELFDISTLTTNTTTYFDIFFTGANKITLTNTTKYVLVITTDASYDASNYIALRRDTTSSTHSGNFAQYTTSWVTQSTYDMRFYIRADSATRTIFSQPKGVVSCDYIDMSTCGTGGGATFYAGANSTDTYNNSGWIFEDAPERVRGQVTSADGHGTI